MMWLLIVIWGMGWLGSMWLALTVWVEQRGYRDYIGSDGRPHDHPGYNPTVLRAAARMVLFGWAWPLLMVRTVYRLTGEGVGKLMVDATRPKEK